MHTDQDRHQLAAAVLRGAESTALVTVANAIASGITAPIGKRSVFQHEGYSLRRLKENSGIR